MKPPAVTTIWNLGLVAVLVIGWTGCPTAVAPVRAGEDPGASEETSRSFRYQDGESSGRVPDVHTHRVEVKAVRGKAYVYATFLMTPMNPVPHQDGQPQAIQVVTLGERKAGDFHAVARFGMRDGKGLPGEQTQLVPWASDGQLDYYGGYARPDTPYDFKLVLDLCAGRVDVLTSGRGDDDWFLLVEGAPLMHPVAEINEARIEQYPQAADIQGLAVRGAPWKERESVRPHPQSKPNRVVKPAARFKLQSMRSLWRRRGRHVTISRDQKRWQGFADVVLSRSGRLLATYCDRRGHGGLGKSVIRASDDLGKTWGPEKVMVASHGANERLQRLKDGSLLFLSGENVPTVELKQSTDNGATWSVVTGFDLRTLGLKTHYAVSHLLEASDGAWFLASSDIVRRSDADQNTPRERLQVFRSGDKGKSWELRALLDTYPSSGHSGSEASILELPDGRLVMYSRESREDGYPAFRVLSGDGGKTWSEPEDLPIPISGRVQADFLPDGRILLTTRSYMGRPALWAWVEDPLASVGSKTGGIHFNDSSSKGLKDGALYIDNDGRSGQFTRYLLRPPHGPNGRIELTAEVLVKENHGHAATIGIPFAGQLRIFPDRLDFVGETTISTRITPDRYHTYRVTSDRGKVQIFVDDKLALEPAKLDRRRLRHSWCPPAVSPILLSFGNYPEPDVYPPKSPWVRTQMFAPQITPAVTGLSLWRRVEATVTDFHGCPRQTSWVAARDGFPDQYRLDHVLEVEASVFGIDQGYSGWTALPDGRIFVVNYTDDTAVAWPVKSVYIRRCPWIRGTYVLPSDLPPLNP